MKKKQNKPSYSNLFKEDVIKEANKNLIVGGMQVPNDPNNLVAPKPDLFFQDEDSGYETSRCEGTTHYTTIWGQVESDTKSFGDWISTC